MYQTIRPPRYVVERWDNGRCATMHITSSESDAHVAARNASVNDPHLYRVAYEDSSWQRSAVAHYLFGDRRP